VTGRLDFRRRDKAEKPGDTFVFGRLLARHDPQAGAANDGVLRRARHIRVVRKGRQAVGKLRILGHVAVEARGGVDHGAFARHEACFRNVAAALVDKQALLGHIGQVLDMAHMQRRVDFHARVKAGQPVAPGRELDVVPRGETFQLGPALPGGGERALVAGCLELGGSGYDLRPGGGGFVGRQPGRLESILVEVKNGGRAVERKAQHLAIWRCVVTGDGGDVVAGVELLASVLHDLAHRDDGALAGHHGGGADLEHLQNVRGVAGAECRDGSRHRFVVGAFKGRHDLVIFLALVELSGQVVDPFTVDRGHGMPPLDFGLGLACQWRAERECSEREGG